jgi:predicted nucleic acid-binding Zn ribbon protein
MSDRKASRPVSIADVMATVLARNGMDTRLSQVTAIDDWPTAVGAQIAQVTEPLSITADGVLWVRVSTAAWMNELSLLAPTLLARLNAVPDRPPVRQLRFRLGRDRSSVSGVDSPR